MTTPPQRPYIRVVMIKCTEHGEQEATLGRDMEGERCWRLVCGHLSYAGC